MGRGINNIKSNDVDDYYDDDEGGCGGDNNSDSANERLPYARFNTHDSRNANVIFSNVNLRLQSNRFPFRIAPWHFYFIFLRCFSPMKLK